MQQVVVRSADCGFCLLFHCLIFIL